MRTKQITCITLIVCLSCISSSGSDDVNNDGNWNTDNIHSTSSSKNKPKFSDFRDLKIHEADEKFSGVNESGSNKPHSRQKRLIWITDDGRLALPPGTSLTITPSLALPFVRYPPDGFFSNISVSLPVTRTLNHLF